MSQPLTSMSQQSNETQSVSLFEPEVIKFWHIPGELINRTQWAVWRWGEKVSSTGRRQKIPHNPVTGRRARTNDSKTWATFEQARRAYVEGDYNGIGFMLSADDPFIVIDLDDCHNPDTGEITPEALAIVARLDSYTEISPSGTGLHIFIRIEAMTVSHATPIEVYSDTHFITITGQLLLTVAAGIEERQEVFVAWEQETFGGSAKGIPERAPSSSPPTTDEAILRRARQAKNGEKFHLLWSGQWKQARDANRKKYRSLSHADLALVELLAFYTQDPAQLDRLFRQSGLYREKWDEQRGKKTYGQRTVAKALASLHKTAGTSTPRPRRAPRSEQRVTHLYEWQRRSETPSEREAYLREVIANAYNHVTAHLDAPSERPLLIHLPCGVGKTLGIAPVANRYDVGWLAPRREMYADVSSVAPYREILPCSPANCPQATQLTAVAALGHNPWPIHHQHSCAYYQQHQQQGSAFYQIAHAPTAFLQRHQGVIVDEFDVSAWLEDLVITRKEVTLARESRRWLDPKYQAVGRLLRAVYETMLEACQRGATLCAQDLFAVLSGHSAIDVVDLLQQVRELDVARDERPRIVHGADVHEAQQQGKVFLPQLVRALGEDVPKWQAAQTGQAGLTWNSRMHVDAQGNIHLIRPRRFHAGSAHQPITILDATAEEAILSRVLGKEVQVVRHDIMPPPHMRHIAVRTGTRYGKGSLVDGKRAAKDRDRVIRGVRLLLARENPDGQRSVGLITYKGCQAELGEALGIPPARQGHFWGVRGSNALEDCEILIVVGTPTPPLREIEWNARALYVDDPVPITTTQQGKRFTDPRLAQLADHLTNAELTHAAHRNRPLRHDGRMVITLTTGTVDALPITEEITALGELPTRQREQQRAKTQQAQDERLEAAYLALCARGESPTVRAVREKAQVQTTAASEWLRRRREE